MTPATTPPPTQATAPPERLPLGEKTLEQPGTSATEQRWTNPDFLAMREQHETADRDLVAGAAELWANHQLLRDQTVDVSLPTIPPQRDPALAVADYPAAAGPRLGGGRLLTTGASQPDAMLADIIATNQIQLEQADLLPGDLTVESAVADIEKLFKPTTEQESALFRDEFLKFPEKQRKLVYQELCDLTLRGHCSAAVLTAVCAGGIRYRAASEQPSAQQAGLDDKALFQPAHGKDPAFIILTEQLFTPHPVGSSAEGAVGERIDARYALRHELAHALLFGLPGFFYNPNDLDPYLGARQGAAPDSQMQSSFDGSPPPLSPDEQQIFDYALAPVGHNPRLVEPFETPYVATLLRRLEAQPADSHLRGYVLHEMLAERLTAYLSSDGSLNDFMKQRIERSFGYQGSEEAGTPFVAVARELEGMLLQARQERWPAAQLVTSFQTLSQEKIPGMASFVKESIVLWKRFGRLHGPMNLPLALPAHLPIDQVKDDRRHKLTAWLANPDKPRPLADYLIDHGLEPLLHDNFATNLGKPLPDKQGKSFWEQLSQLLEMVSKLLAG